MPSPATTTRASPQPHQHRRHDSGSATASVDHLDNQSFLDWPFGPTSENAMTIDPSIAFSWQQPVQSGQHSASLMESGLPPSPYQSHTSGSISDQQPSPQWANPTLTTNDFNLLHASFASPPPIAPIASQTPRACNCTSTTFSALQILHERSSSSTPFDLILHTNKEVLTRISQLLACTVCAAAMDAALALTLAASLAKLLGWYSESIVRRPPASLTPQTLRKLTDAQPSSQQQQKSDTQGTRRAMMQKELSQSSTSSAEGRAPPLAHTPIVLGTYELDSSDDDLVKIHVVLSELRKVDSVLSAFGDRFQKLVTAAGMPKEPGEEVQRVEREGTAAAEGTFYGEVIVFLRRKLRSVVEGLQKEIRMEFADV
ncbi:uncharacterized protein KY384_007490 [Bacidia gigantensis]|uniref:uncharacterized protein n=1 Tax=Bacidia gigantensis TaxID=2732470 RepID=UPI001D041730|nr:uncharacterized protein KY384_007490 [Bacidia gigantensis]KAG8527338.1 hypothetical protein KY384_007490 [Bacidia gigantensis]